MKKLFPALLTGVALCAQAQTSDFVQTTPVPYLQQDLTASLGLGLASTLKYVSSSERTIRPLPVIDMQWQSGIFFSSISGFGIDFGRDGTWQYGARLGLESYQAQSASNQNDGPGNTITDIEPGVFANYLINQHITLLSSLSSGAGTGTEHDGIQASLGLRGTTTLTDRQRLVATLGTTWASQHYMQSYFGVTTIQANTSGFAVYTPEAGIKDIKLSLGWNWAIDKKWSLAAGGSVSHPMNAAATSPLVLDQNNIVGYVATYYNF